MISVLQRRVVRHADIAIRTASVSEIDTLCAIDLDASTLFERAGLHLELPSDHEFAIAERNRWLRCLAAGTVLLAMDATNEPIGFAAAGVRDDEPYLDQLSVRTEFMRLGIGTVLLEATARMAKDAGGRSLWLTTYGHLSWNRPFYERAGFIAIPERECGPDISQELNYERRWLPFPEERVVMRKDLGSSA
jgi:GNAT superfamily N-acetyltransferase